MIHFKAGFCISLILVSNVRPSISGMLMSERIMLISFWLSKMVSASRPLWAKKNSYSPLRIFLRKYCVRSNSRSISSSTLSIFTESIVVLGYSLNWYKVIKKEEECKGNSCFFCFSLVFFGRMLEMFSNFAL